jgi:hypothetical protein
VVFAGGLYTASRERITAHEFQTKPYRVLAPTLCLVIPDSSSSSSSNLPSFALTVPSPISPTHPSSPILPAPAPLTCESYLAAAASAPPTSRVPSLPPQRCPHMLRLLSRSRRCGGCEQQQLACEIWWSSRSATLCAPAAPSTVETRAVYCALDLSFGLSECACVGQGMATTILFMRRCSSKSSDTGIKSKSEAVARAPAPSRILRVFRRACHVLSAPTRYL